MNSWGENEMKDLRDRIASRLSVRRKLMGSSGLLLAMSVVIGLVAILGLSQVADKANESYTQATAAIQHLENANKTLVDKARLVTYGVVVTNDAAEQTKVDTGIAADDKTIADDLSAYQKLELNAAEQATLAEFKDAQARYETAVQSLREMSRKGDTAGAAAAIPAAATIRTEMMAKIDALGKMADDKAAALNSDVQGTYEFGRTLTIAVLLFSLLVGIGLAYYLSRVFVRNVTAVQTTLTSMADNCASYLADGLAAFARNDLTVQVRAATNPIESYGADEIGQTAAVTNRMLGKLQETIDSYELARAGLIGAIDEVRTASEAVSRTSRDLTDAAGQSGHASGQIAQTINQVAAGAGEQARAASDTSEAALELRSIIEEVSSGAGKTSRQVDVASMALGEMATAISSASTASDEVCEVAGRAASAAQHGREAVRETVVEMGRIRGTVVEASARVAELGSKSDQIGAIVEVIDDIAEQTNLLALNAAIEAARAGEQGKGFAVVADEVRKLAERSSRATKEIASLIDEVQRGTNDAVQAMTAGATEVERGSVLAENAGRSLEEISDAVEATQSAATRITSAVEAMSSASNGVVTASDAIASIASHTNEAAERMTTSAETVSRSVQAIAAISEENSASAEEVSAATEEMSAQAEEVVASSETLAEMARSLDSLVARFRTDGTGSTSNLPIPVAPARRSSAGRARAA